MVISYFPYETAYISKDGDNVAIDREPLGDWGEFMSR